MKRCKTIEAKLELLKLLIQIWSGFILALSSAFGFLLYRDPKNYPLLDLVLILLILFALVWIAMIAYAWSLIAKLEICKGD